MFREQSRVLKLSTAVTDLKKAIKSLTKCLDASWMPTVLSFMRSLPNGEQQEAHQDYPEHIIASAKTKQPTKVPASMIYALEAETQLRVFDDCFTVMEKSKSALSTYLLGTASYFVAI
ncbi:hypothetical protein PC110_g6348 [Phytophthora cactorum]|uniref:Uncharacterized protein n=1 Tax=Phytophthora cactorum TaxID=29920 RepID=A0A329SKP6_9STRA|nr:hypothetical protein C6341_g7349 [Phytophthora cactorum]KAG3195092.1 hypothetical protein PC128_g8771 [Phytophthora cactorum]RAW37397.1 hypothetical protein PC110_g6348 [Phytophthora cactorum]